MYIRVATLDDKEEWDSFVNSEGGSFFHYFDWKYIYEIRGYQYIPLLLENTASQIIGILPVVKKQQGSLYSSLISLPEGASGGFVLKKDLTNIEKSQALTMLLRYVDTNYSKSCSTFTLKENLSLMHESKTELTEVLIDNGFRLRYDSDAQLPCTYILVLKQPFEENIWHDLWGKNTRRSIRHSNKRGVYVKEDKDLKYIDDFVNMMTSTFNRKGSIPLPREEVVKRLTIFNKTKLFVAFLNKKAIGASLCYYTPSTCYGSKVPSYNIARGNDVTMLIACEVIRDACKDGYQYFEFGTTFTSSLAAWKEHFKGTKVPMMIYEKKYSNLRTIIEKMFSLVTYVWNNKRKLFGKLIRLRMFIPLNRKGWFTPLKLATMDIVFCLKGIKSLEPLISYLIHHIKK